MNEAVFRIKFTCIFNRYALTAYRVCLSRKRLRAVSIRVITVVLRYFFLPQFQRKRGVLTCPIINVDHELDDKIPFKPEYRPVYMSFTMLWISTLGYLYKAYGRKAEADMFYLLRLIERSYVEAYGVYQRVMTTTRRPKPNRWDIGLGIMQALDPHLHCVPSLHVMIVCINWLFLDYISRKPGRPDLSRLRNLVYKQSIKIIESILLLKQHSVNCIPAGLYTVSYYMEGFSLQVAEEFIDRLFTELEPDLPAREEIRAVIKKQYLQLMEENNGNDGDYKNVLLDFLKDLAERRNIN